MPRGDRPPPPARRTDRPPPRDRSCDARRHLRRRATARPLTILIGADTFLPHVNGAARFAERLAAGLVTRGHDVHVMAPSRTHREHGTFTEVIEGQPMTMHRLPSWRWYPHDWLTFVMPFRSKYYSRRVLDTVKPDVVHIQSHIVIGRGLTREAHKRGIPVVATNHVMAENVLDFTIAARRRGHATPSSSRGRTPSARST